MFHIKLLYEDADWQKALFLFVSISFFFQKIQNSKDKKETIMKWVEGKKEKIKTASVFTGMTQGRDTCMAKIRCRRHLEQTLDSLPVRYAVPNPITRTKSPATQWPATASLRHWLLSGHQTQALPFGQSQSDRDVFRLRLASALRQYELIITHSISRN